MAKGNEDEELQKVFATIKEALGDIWEGTRPGSNKAIAFTEHERRYLRDIPYLILGHVHALKKRIAALEATQFKFIGTWTEGLEASPGNCVVYDGSTWIAKEKTMSKPGTDGTYQLAARKGRDGRSK